MILIINLDTFQNKLLSLNHISLNNIREALKQKLSMSYSLIKLSILFMDISSSKFCSQFTLFPPIKVQACCFQFYVLIHNIIVFSDYYSILVLPCSSSCSNCSTDFSGNYRSFIELIDHKDFALLLLLSSIPFITLRFFL